MNKYRVISISIIVIMTLNILLFNIEIFAKNNNSSEVITGTYQYSSSEGNNIQIQDTFEYRDDCFTRSSFLGCKHLEVLSIQAASASKCWYVPEIDNDEIDASQNAHNIVEMLNNMKFENVSTNTYYTKEKQENSMGVAVGKKVIIQNGKPYTLLAIIPRSAGYKEEWAGNAIVGDGDIHEGFKSARDEILRYINKYIKDNNIKGDLKVWIAGYSRGAAVTDMLGGFFAGGGIDYFGNDVSITPEDVYCYTFGTPKTIKNGLSKNIELSVSGNRTETKYLNDTPGASYQYTNGGTVSTEDSIYGGIRNLINPNDVFPLLPPENWGFTHYGKEIPSNQSLISEQAMLEELKNISQYMYNQYTENGEIKQFKRKTFYLKSLSIVDSEGETTTTDFIRERFKGLTNLVTTNKKYNDEQYQEALKSFAGTFGMVLTIFMNYSSTENINNADLINALAYTYLAYASDELQKEGKADNETEAITIAIEDMLSYFSGDEIDKNTFTVDNFIELFAKFFSENENEPIADTIVSGIVNMVPEDKRAYLSLFSGFDKNSKERPVTAEEGIKAFIKACYCGADPECSIGAEFAEPILVRNALCMTMCIVLASDYPEVAYLLRDETGTITGKEADFKNVIDLLLTNIKQVKNEDGIVIKTYSDLSEMADEKMVSLIDSLLSQPIEKSEELYGEEYKDELIYQVDTFKNNITQARKMISEFLLYSDNGFNTSKILENISTLIDNGKSIPVTHYFEIYLAQARTANRYEDHKNEDFQDEDVESEEKPSTDLEEELKEEEINKEILTNPKTGDNIDMWMWQMIVSIIGIVVSIKIFNRIK